jgi:CRISPR-associated protein Cas1
MRQEYSARDYHKRNKTEPRACDYCGTLFLPDAPGLLFCSIDCFEAYEAGKTKPKVRTCRLNESRPEPPRPKPNVAKDDSPGDDELWAARAEYWKGQEKKSTARKRVGERKPLILTGHGVQLRVDRGALFVRNGFTHYPQAREEWRLFPGDWRLPSRIILLDTDGSLSLHVITWLSEQGVPLVMINWQGKAVSVIGGDGTTTALELRQAQLEARNNGRGLQLAIQLIRDKIIASQETLKTLPSGRCKIAIGKLGRALKELRGPIVRIEQVMLIEARAAADYFGVWHTLPIKWKGTERHPIPDEWRFIGKRESFISGKNRHATDPVNAILNYAYAVLESQVLTGTVAAGLDPSIGYLHACRPGRMALVYDLMEPLRPRVDLQVLDFVRTHSFGPGDFLLTSNGSCRIVPQLVKKLIAVIQEIPTLSPTIDALSNRGLSLITTD